MVRKGSPVGVRQRAPRKDAAARFLHFRSEFADPFRIVPGEKGSRMADVRLCAAVDDTEERVPAVGRGTDAVHAGRNLFASAPECRTGSGRGPAFDRT